MHHHQLSLFLFIISCVTLLIKIPQTHILALSSSAIISSLISHLVLHNILLLSLGLIILVIFLSLFLYAYLITCGTKFQALLLSHDHNIITYLTSHPSKHQIHVHIINFKHFYYDHLVIFFLLCHTCMHHNITQFQTLLLSIGLIILVIFYHYFLYAYLITELDFKHSCYPMIIILCTFDQFLKIITIWCLIRKLTHNITQFQTLLLSHGLIILVIFFTIFVRIPHNVLSIQIPHK